MSNEDYAWDWYSKNIAYQYDRTGCTLSEMKDGTRIITIPNHVVVGRVQAYFGVRVCGEISRTESHTTYGFEYDRR